MVFLDTSNIISTDGASPVGRLSGSNSNVGDLHSLPNIDFFRDVPWAVFCNDTGIGDLEDASSCSGDITLRLKYYWNGAGANFSGLA